MFLRNLLQCIWSRLVLKLILQIRSFGQVQPFCAVSHVVMQNVTLEYTETTPLQTIFYFILSDGKINDFNFGWRRNKKIIKPKVNNKQIYELQECWDKKIALTFQLHCNKFTTHYIYVKEIIAIFSSKNFNSFYPIVPFYNPWKSLKAFGFLRILGDIEMKHWAKMG